MKRVFAGILLTISVQFAMVVVAAGLLVTAAFLPILVITGTLHIKRSSADEADDNLLSFEVGRKQRRGS